MWKSERRRSETRACLKSNAEIIYNYDTTMTKIRRNTQVGYKYPVWVFYYIFSGGKGEMESEE